MGRVRPNGICALCGGVESQAAMARHLRRCAPAHDSAKGATTTLHHLRVRGTENAIYWLDLEVRGETRLRQLDTFLRRIWLECCGHLSSFHIGGWTYIVTVDRTFETTPNERSMSVRVSEVLPAQGQRFRHEYDFGSTTDLTLRIMGSRQGSIGRSPVRLLARNRAPIWQCAVCGEPATLVCSFCVYDGDPFCCAKHAPEHACGEDEAFLPVVNSPRMGVCGYTGEA